MDIRANWQTDKVNPGAAMSAHSLHGCAFFRAANNNYPLSMDDSFFNWLINHLVCKMTENLPELFVAYIYKCIFCVSQLCVAVWAVYTPIHPKEIVFDILCKIQSDVFGIFRNFASFFLFNQSLHQQHTFVLTVLQGWQLHCATQRKSENCWNPCKLGIFTWLLLSGTVEVSCKQNALNVSLKSNTLNAFLSL